MNRLTCLLVGAVVSALPCVLKAHASETTHAFGSSREGRLAIEALRWAGTPYKLGGTTRAGIDCSAYVRTIFETVFGVSLPRTTKRQIQMGVPLTGPVSPSGLRPGDLLFYLDEAGKTTHVVLYIGGGVVTHAIKGRGVVLEGLPALKSKRIVMRRMLRVG